MLEAHVPVRAPDSTFNKTLDLIFRDYDGIPFRIRFWDGSTWQSSVDDSVFEIVLNTEEAWYALTGCPDELSLGEQYVNGNLDVNGDLYLALRALPKIEDCIMSTAPSSGLLLSRLTVSVFDEIRQLIHLRGHHSKARDAAAISYHYDKPSDFYRLWLGPSMVYSCAYFEDWQNELTVAQTDKMDLVCRKLALKPHDRFRDIGCGWGSLLLHAVGKYAVSALGISLSKEQVTFADKAIRNSGLEDSCVIQLKHYRDLADGQVKFDKVSSVGMCEHVGQKNIASYFSDVYGMLTEGGLFLNHSITRSIFAPRKRTSFIDSYVFPDGELITLTEMVKTAERAGFEVRDVEDLREHYEETLHRWVSELIEHEEDVLRLTSRETFRIWKLYMSGSAEAFRRGEIAVHQLLLSKNVSGRSTATATRGEWYRARPN